ncbi:MAG: hypothetical protein ACKVX7_04775 [Planctomycetota bacterium]
MTPRPAASSLAMLVKELQQLAAQRRARVFRYVCLVAVIGITVLTHWSLEAELARVGAMRWSRFRGAC